MTVDQLTNLLAARNPMVPREALAAIAEAVGEMCQEVRIDEREACAKIAEDDTSFMMLQDFGLQSTCTQVRTNIAEAIRSRGK